MRKLALLTFVTVDGVMQAPSDADEDRSRGFERGGWARLCWDEVMAQVMREAMAEPYDLLLGRGTYDSFSASFAEASDEDPLAQRFERAAKYVVTSRNEGLDWANTVHLSGNVVDAITQLKEGDGPLLQVHGSWQLVQTLIQHDLVDEYRLWTFPVIVGGGKRLFEATAAPAELHLVKAATCQSGATMTILRRVAQTVRS